MGGRSSSSSSSKTTTNNIDERIVTESGIGRVEGSGNQVNSTDAVKAIAGMGADTIKSMGGAVVQLNGQAVQGNLQMFDRTVSGSVALVDKLIDASSSLGQAAMTTFQPAENKAQDTSLKLGMIAAAAVAATLLLRK